MNKYNPRFILQDEESIEVEDESGQKQNMSLDGFTTTKDLDLELESILKSIEPDVITAIKKIK